MTRVSVARSKRALPGLASECETATDCLTGVCGFVWGATKGFQHPIVVRASKLFDPTSGRLLDSPVVLISGNHIEAVGSRDLATPANARMIDLGGATLLPGFIDAHTLLTFDVGSGGYESLCVSIPRVELTSSKIT